MPIRSCTGSQLITWFCLLHIIFDEGTFINSLKISEKYWVDFFSKKNFELSRDMKNEHSEKDSYKPRNANR